MYRLYQSFLMYHVLDSTLTKVVMRHVLCACLLVLEEVSLILIGCDVSSDVVWYWYELLTGKWQTGGNTMILLTPLNSEPSQANKYHLPSPTNPDFFHQGRPDLLELMRTFAWGLGLFIWPPGCSHPTRPHPMFFRGQGLNSCLSQPVGGNWGTSKGVLFQNGPGRSRTISELSRTNSNICSTDLWVPRHANCSGPFHKFFSVSPSPSPGRTTLWAGHGGCQEGQGRFEAWEARGPLSLHHTTCPSVGSPWRPVEQEGEGGPQPKLRVFGGDLVQSFLMTGTKSYS